MLFSSIPFLFYFLPAVLVVYFLAPKGLKNAVLLVASLLFYAWGEPRYIFIMAGAVLSGYLLGLLIERDQDTRRSKLWLILSCVISLGMLGYFKYADFFIENVNALTGAHIKLLQIALPIGISFYTFQILSYTVDVYRGDAKAQRNLLDFATYVALFPQLIAGPIVRYVDIAAQLEHRSSSVEKAYLGIRRFLFGLSKKILLANQFGVLCDRFHNTDEKTVLFYWMYAVAFSLQIYFDFSGYSDMAIGLGKVFGFDFLENFNYPYVSKSITEFWRRWHMSLGSWFRDYVYIPLGGNRVTKWKWFRNIFIVWLLTGFWHGASWNFIAWGLFFAVLLVMEKMWLGNVLDRMPGVVRHIYVLAAVIFSFVIFNANGFSGAVSEIYGMFGGGGIQGWDGVSLYYFRSYACVFLVAFLGCTPLPKMLIHKLKTEAGAFKIVQIIEPVWLVVMLLLATAFLVDGSFNPFLYFRF